LNFILLVESWGWRELGAPGGLTRFRRKAVMGILREIAYPAAPGSERRLLVRDI
jgi:hypothetical protein